MVTVVFPFYLKRLSCRGPALTWFGLSSERAGPPGATATLTLPAGARTVTSPAGPPPAGCTDPLRRGMPVRSRGFVVV